MLAATVIVLAVSCSCLHAETPWCGEDNSISPGFSLNISASCEEASGVTMDFEFDARGCQDSVPADCQFEFDARGCQDSVPADCIFPLDNTACASASLVSSPFALNYQEQECAAATPAFAVFTLDNAVCTNGSLDSANFRLNLPNPITVRVGDAKRLPDDTVVTVEGGVVTAVGDGWSYIESQDRSAGIRVDSLIAVVSRNEVIDVDGVVMTDGNLERHIDSPRCRHLGNGMVSPLAMCVRDLGGGDFGVPPLGQTGITGATGTNNIGILVRTWGAIIDRDTANPLTWFLIDDGSGVSLKCLVPTGVTLNPSWTYVAVTGISSCEKVGQELHRLLRIRDQNDLTAY